LYFRRALLPDPLRADAFAVLGYCVLFYQDALTAWYVSDEPDALAYCVSGPVIQVGSRGLVDAVPVFPL
jgi:hypothetical protein